MNNKSTRLLISIFFSTVFNTVAQPTLSYQHCYGGTGDEAAINLIKTFDHGFLVVGSSDSNDGDITNAFGFDDVWLMRLDSNLNVLWKKTYGGSDDEEGTSAIQTADSGFVILANTESDDGDVNGYHDNGDVWIFKIDASGNIQWQKSFGGSDYETGLNVMINSMNEIIVTGGTQSADGDLSTNNGDMDLFLLKLSSAGNVISVKTFGGSGRDVGYQTVEILNGSLVIGGSTTSNDFDVSSNHGSEDVWILEIDSSGILQWEKTYGGSDAEETTNICLLNNGNYFFAGYTESFDGDVTNNHGSDDVWTVIIDSASKNIIHKNCFGGNDDDDPFRIDVTENGTILIAGETASIDGDFPDNNGDFDAFLINVDTSLNLLWEKTIGGSEEDDFYGVCSLDGNSILASGFTYSNDEDVSGNHSAESDLWIAKLDNSNSIRNIAKNDQSITLFPNPTKNYINIQTKNPINDCKIEIQDLDGNIIYSKSNFHIGNNPEKISTEFASGSYLLIVFSNSEIIYKNKFDVMQ